MDGVQAGYICLRVANTSAQGTGTERAKETAGTTGSVCEAKDTTSDVNERYDGEKGRGCGFARFYAVGLDNTFKEPQKGMEGHTMTYGDIIRLIARRADHDRRSKDGGKLLRSYKNHPWYARDLPSCQQRVHGTPHDYPGGI